MWEYKRGRVQRRKYDREQLARWCSVACLRSHVGGPSFNLLKLDVGCGAGDSTCVQGPGTAAVRVAEACHFADSRHAVNIRRRYILVIHFEVGHRRKKLVGGNMQAVRPVLRGLLRTHAINTTQRFFSHTRPARLLAPPINIPKWYLFPFGLLYVHPG